MEPQIFYKISSTTKISKNLLYAVISSVFDFFDLLPMKERERFLLFLYQKLAFYISNKTTYRNNKMARYDKQASLQQLFMDKTWYFTDGMIYTLANFLNINICIAEDRHGSYHYSIFAPIQNSHLKGTMVIKRYKKKFYVLQNENNECLINPYKYSDLSRFFSLYRTQKNNSLLPYYKYKIKDLHHLAQQFKITIQKKGRGINNINKSKRELYNELKELLL